MHVYTAKGIMHGTGTKTRARQKHYDRLLFINVLFLLTGLFYLQDMAPPTFIQKKRKGYPQRQGRQTGSVDLYDVEPG